MDYHGKDQGTADKTENFNFKVLLKQLIQNFSRCQYCKINNGNDANNDDGIMMILTMMTKLIKRVVIYLGINAVSSHSLLVFV